MYVALTLFTAITLLGSDKKSATAPQGDLQAAIKARTEATELQLEAAKTDQKVRALMHKVVAEADAKQTEGNVLLGKDRYDDALCFFQEAARLYR